MDSAGKVFGIGCSRTGTMSLCQAMKAFGLNALHYPPAKSMLAQDFSVLSGVDFANDIPVSLFFRELDTAFPGSRFILTIRNKAGWLESCAQRFFEENMRLKWADTPEIDLFQRFYQGHSFYNEAGFSKAYDDHVQSVRTYFAERPDDILELSVEEPAAIKKKRLSDFLGLPPFDGPFPHFHKSDRAA